MKRVAGVEKIYTIATIEYKQIYESSDDAAFLTLVYGCRDRCSCHAIVEPAAMVWCDVCRTSDRYALCSMPLKKPRTAALNAAGSSRCGVCELCSNKTHSACGTRVWIALTIAGVASS